VATSSTCKPARPIRQVGGVSHHLHRGNGSAGDIAAHRLEVGRIAHVQHLQTGIQIRDICAVSHHVHAVGIPAVSQPPNRRSAEGSRNSNTCKPAEPSAT